MFSPPSPLACADVRRDRERIPHRKPRPATATPANQSSTFAASAAASASSADSAQQQSAQHGQAGHPYSQSHAGSASPDIPRTSAQDITLGLGGASSTAASGAAAAAAAGDGSELYGSSYTNRRTREVDLLHDIVRQTRSNFIDVATSASSAQLSSSAAASSAAASPPPTGKQSTEREERSRVYATNINKITQPTTDRADREKATAGAAVTSHLSSSLLTSSLLAAPPVVVSLLALPLPLSATASSGSSLAELLSAAALRPSDRRWLLSRAQQVSEAITEAHIATPSRLVLAFEELQQPA